MVGNALGTEDGINDGMNDKVGNTLNEGKALGLLLGALEGVHDGIGGQSQFSGMQELHVALHVAATPSIVHKSSDVIW